MITSFSCFSLRRFYCVKSVRLRSFYGPYFLGFGLNTKTCGVCPVFSPNAGKYWPEKLWIRTLFTECYLYLKIFCLLFFFLLQALNNLFLYIVNRIIYFFKKMKIHYDPLKKLWKDIIFMVIQIIPTDTEILWIM